MTKYYTPREVAEMLKISYEKALGFIKYSGIKYVKIGNQYRVSETSLNVFFCRNTLSDVSDTRY